MKQWKIGTATRIEKNPSQRVPREDNNNATTNDKENPEHTNNDNDDNHRPTTIDIYLALGMVPFRYEMECHINDQATLQRQFSPQTPVIHLNHSLMVQDLKRILDFYSQPAPPPPPKPVVEEKEKEENKNGGDDDNDDTSSNDKTKKKKKKKTKAERQWWDPNSLVLGAYHMQDDGLLIVNTQYIDFEKRKTDSYLLPRRDIWRNLVPIRRAIWQMYKRIDKHVKMHALERVDELLLESFSLDNNLMGLEYPWALQVWVSVAVGLCFCVRILPSCFWLFLLCLHVDDCTTEQISFQFIFYFYCFSRRFFSPRV